VSIREYCALSLLAFVPLHADYRAPAGTRPAAVGTVLPGGRLLSPYGQQFITGPGPFGLAISPDGSRVVTANSGPDYFSLSFLEKAAGAWKIRNVSAVKREENDKGDDDEWHSNFMGLAFDGPHVLYAADGESGRVRAIDPDAGRTLHIMRLNGGGFSDSFSGDMALDKTRRILYVLDQTNFRVVIFDLRTRRRVASVRVGRLPFAIALSPDGQRAFVTNIGMFEYRMLPGIDPKDAQGTGLLFPPFGFPSRQARNGVRAHTAHGDIDVPGLGDPNAAESNSVAVLDVSDPARARVLKFIRTGRPLGKKSDGGSSPSAVLAAGDRVYVSNGANDSISVIGARSLTVLREIAIRVPGLDALRGVLPIGLAWDARRKRLLVAEAGINAVGIVDPDRGAVLGHIPAGWFPTQVGVDGDSVYVANCKGGGIGPNATLEHALPESFQAERRRGSIGAFQMPADSELAGLTKQVLDNAGLTPADAQPPLPAGIRHVVIIVKENRTFDEVFGDMDGAPKLARYGRHVTPNHHAIADQWAMSDNFYADSEVSVDGHHWLVGSYPNAFTESSLNASYAGGRSFRVPTTAPGRLSIAESNSSVEPEDLLEAGTIWHHLQRHGITFRNFGEGFELYSIREDEGEKPTGARFSINVPMPEPLYRNTSRDYPTFNLYIPDQLRATKFIDEIERMYRKPGRDLPQLMYVYLPNDHTMRARPKDGYPTETSYVVDNDLALGRVMEYLTKSPWWSSMAVFVTEDDAQSGVDHVDAHRTVMLVASPYAKRGYMSHANSSFTGMLKTAFRILHLPPLNLFDASASDLSDCFQAEADPAAYQVRPVDQAIFDPAKAKDPRDPAPGPRMDDPREISRQHREQEAAGN
jgi:DNA-binding beta-propeller fold protein YncE